GYWQIDGLTVGFASAGYDPAAGNLGTFSGVVVPIPDLPGYIYGFTMPTGIRADGTVVGYYFDGVRFRGFVVSNGQYTTIDVPGAAHTFILGTNSRRSPDLVGQYVDAVGQIHGFVLRDGTFTTIDVPFGPGTSVNAISDHRQIVGSFDSNGDRVGFRASLPQ